jgi:hypothetical protein
LTTRRSGRSRIAGRGGRCLRPWRWRIPGGFVGGEFFAVFEGGFGTGGADSFGADLGGDDVDVDEFSGGEGNGGGQDAKSGAEDEGDIGHDLFDEFGLALGGEFVALSLACFGGDFDGAPLGGKDVEEEGVFGVLDAADVAAVGLAADALELSGVGFFLLACSGDFGFLVGFGDDGFLALALLFAKNAGLVFGVVVEECLQLWGEISKGDAGDAVGVAEADFISVKPGDFDFGVSDAFAGGEGRKGERRGVKGEAEGEDEQRKEGPKPGRGAAVEGVLDIGQHSRRVGVVYAVRLRFATG